MTEALPDEQWRSIRLLSGDADSDAREWEISASVDAVLSAVTEARVFRTGRRPSLTDRYFQLYLYPETGYPTVLYVTSSGGILAAENGDFDHYRYYQSAVDLYGTLSKTAQSPA